MNDARLTIRIPRGLLEEARQYAQENQTTLTRLVSQYLHQLATMRDPLADAPIVRRLSGTLSQDISEDDYRKHLEDKYGRPA
jgi:ABC-type transporter Mla subunit MlaD